MSTACSFLFSRRGLGTLLLVGVCAGMLLVDARPVVAQTPVTGEAVPCEDGQANRYPCSNVDLLSFLPISDLSGADDTQLNDLWGWTDPETGNEYALVGRTDGVAFVDVSTPTEPMYVGELPTHTEPSPWRDLKVHDDHVFVVSEATGHGMQVFDLTRLRTVDGAEAPVTFDATTHYDGVERAHNVAINTESEFAFVVGAHGEGTSCQGGLHMVDISDPTSPTFEGCFTNPAKHDGDGEYTHDAQCVTYRGPDADYAGGEVCFSANETVLNIADVTDKENPRTIANATYPLTGYVHQAWLTENHRYLYVDDELDERNGDVDRTRTLVFDVTDLDQPELVTSHLGPTGAIDHNQYIDGSYSYQANYQSGLRILDIGDPENPSEVAHFDTYPEANEAAFDGAWSTYPFFDRNVVLVSSIGEGLFIVRPELSPILSIMAESEGSTAHLEWRTSSSFEISRMEVEHQGPRDAGWTVVSTVEGRGGGGVQRHTYTAQDLEPGTHRYRIRHVSASGTAHTSRTVSVRVLPTEPFVARGPYPNPSQTQALFEIILRQVQDLRVTVYDAMGRRVAVLLDRPAERGVVHRFRLPTAEWASGTYFLRVRGEAIQTTRRLNVVR